MISDVYYPRINGVSTSIATFRRELSALGHQVTLIAPDYPGQASPDQPWVHRVPSRYLALDPEDRVMRWGALQRAVSHLAGAGVDLVHVQTPFLAHYAGVRIARALRIPVVETYHTFFEEYLYCYVRWLPRSLLRLAARRFTTRQCNALDAVVVPSQPMADVLHGYGVRAPLTVIPTGIEADTFSAGEGGRFRHRHDIAAERPLLLYVGRVAHEKNIGFLVEVVDRLRCSHPDVLLVIAGEGPARTALERQVEESGLQRHVRFVGYLARDGALQDCYRAADVFVFASRTETQGLVLLEAMALGVPVVSTAVMGTAAVLVEGEGALIAGDDVVDFAARVERVLADPDLHTALRSAACRYAQGWSAAAMAARLADHYRQVCTANRERHETAVGKSRVRNVP
jgi:glycosyltransferase involved in cell wall biosynthesis